MLRSSYDESGSFCYSADVLEGQAFKAGAEVILL